MSGSTEENKLLQMTTRFHYIICALALCLTIFASAQETETQEDNSLKQQYQTLKKESNNYQIYKVVKVASMDAFWNSVSDTLETSREKIKSLNSEVKTLNTTVTTLETGIAERDTSLANQEYMIEHMSFMGVDMTKTGYSTFTWSIILVLIIGIAVIYFRFQSANKVTKSTRSEFGLLQEEFEEHKKKTREKETKLKRDLQTEINRVEELKGKLGTSS